jgi:hypothetical protein
MATGVTDTASTNASALIPEVWAHTTRDSLLANLVLANLVDRSFESEVAGRPADTIHVDGVGGTTDDTRTGFDVTANITLGAGGDLQSEVITFLTQVDISINTHAYKYWDLEFELDLMTQMPLMQRGADRTSYVVAQKVDDDLAGEPDGVSSSVGTLAEPLTDDNILRSVQYLNDGNAQEENRYGYVSAAQQIEFLKIEKYINSLYQTALPTPTDGNFRGFFGSLYGVNWYMSTNVEGTNAAGHDNAMFQKEAIALVMIDNQRVATDYEISTDSFRHAVHSIYGIKLIRDTGSIVWLKGA